MYDCIIIGTGPAGLSAALNLKTYQKDFLWFGSKNLSARGRLAEKIFNYPGFPEITGEELFARFEEHIRSAALEITEKTVTMVMYSGKNWMVLADNEIFEANSLVLCTGVMMAKPLENEERLLGHGVSYCATCDGRFYKGKKIAVVSNDPRYEHEIEYLAGLAAEVIWFPSYKEAKAKASNITISKDMPVGIKGEKKAEALTLRSGAKLAIEGVFCLRNAITPAKLVPGLALEDGHIVTDRHMATNLAGCFAAGDCTGRPYQYTKAVGEGNVAAHSVIDYLADLQK